MIERNRVEGSRRGTVIKRGVRNEVEGNRRGLMRVYATSCGIITANLSTWYLGLQPRICGMHLYEVDLGRGASFDFKAGVRVYLHHREGNL